MNKNAIVLPRNKRSLPRAIAETLMNAKRQPKSGRWEELPRYETTGEVKPMGGDDLSQALRDSNFQW